MKPFITFEIRGKTISIDYEKGIITFPDDCAEKEIGYLAHYLDHEGFLHPITGDYDPTLINKSNN